MSSAADKVLQAGLALSEEERRSVAERLLLSVDDDDDELRAEELTRRIERYRSGEEPSVSLEDVRNEVRQRIGRR